MRADTARPNPMDNPVPAQRIVITVALSITAIFAPSEDSAEARSEREMRNQVHSPQVERLAAGDSAVVRA